ncbi:MAG: hypothetical protein IJX52_01190 [Oscillibacter sp.]|nr:hypothetical protein [Oscillibacter sp.]
MQDPRTMEKITKDTVWYIARPSIKYAQGIGTYASYDIAAYDCFQRDIVEIALDVTSSRSRALRIVERFNRSQLAPCHLAEAILDMLP